MAKNAPAFSPRDRIDHRVYGTGTIIEKNDRHTTIAFDEAGTRKFMTDMVELSRSDTPAPPKPSRKRKPKPSK